MAVTGKFAADFSAFEAAVQKADVSLRGMETGAGKVGTSLNKMANALSGTKMIQDATLMADAVNRVGGVSKLTEAELSRLSAQAKEAAAKLTAMGQTVPPGIQRIADATGNATKQTLDWKGALTTAAGAFGVAFSVGAIVQFGKSVFDSAGKIHDMSSQLGISTDAVQGFKFAAEQAGSSLDAVGTALTKMNVNLAGGDKATVQALKDAGLSFQAIRSMKPEDAFLAITDAIAKIPDPMKQSDVALQIFGRSAAELLPAIKEGFRGAADGAAKMSEDTINSLEAAGDAWGKLADKVTIVTGTLIAKAMAAASAVTSSWKGFALYAENIIKFGVGPATAMAAALEEATRAGQKNRDINLSLPGPLKQTAEQLAAAAAAAKKYGDAFNAMFGKFSGQAATEQMKMLDAVFRSMAKSGQITEDQIDAIVKEALKLQNEGAKLTSRLWDIVRATTALGPGLSTTAIDISKIGTQIAIEIPKIDAFSLALKRMRELPDSGLIPKPAPTLGTIIPIDIKGLLKDWDDHQQRVEHNKKALGELSQAFAQLAQVAGGSFGGIVRELGTLIAAMDMAQKAGLQMKAGFDQGGFAGMTQMAAGALAAAAALAQVTAAGSTAGRTIKGAFAGAQAGAAFGPWGVAIGGAVGALTGFLRGMNAGREAVKDFAASFGGFDGLREKMLALADGGDRLWKALTQSLGKGDQKGAAALIAEINAALANTPGALAAAAGYQTTAQLQAIADKAKTVYDYMVSSGKYSAGELARAFTAMAEAQATAVGINLAAQKAAIDAISAKHNEAIGKLKGELASFASELQAEADAPEYDEIGNRIYGVVELQQMARKKDLDAQIAAAEKGRDAEVAAKEDEFAAMLAAGTAVDTQLRALFGKPLEIPYRFVAQNAPAGYSGGSATYTPPAATSRASGGSSSLQPIVVQVDGIRLLEVMAVTAQRNGLVVV